MIQFKPAVYTRQATLEALKVEKLAEKVQNDINAAANAGQWKTYCIDASFGTEV